MSLSLLASAAEARTALLELNDWCDELHIAMAWASSSNGTAPHWNRLDLRKVQRALIGTHFFQTEPRVLRELGGHGVLKVISEPTGVFHPKVVVGRSGNDVRAVIGSSNLTAGGFSLNTEIGVLFEETADHPEMVRLLAVMDELWARESAFVPSAEWMKWYEERYQRRPRPPATSGPVPGAPQPAADVLGLDWSEYFALLLAHEGRHSVHGQALRVFQKKSSYRAEIRLCQRAFRAHSSFADMPSSERALVGGFGGGSSGFLGHMGRAIQFRDLVANRPEEIAAVLDPLPARGTVPEATIDRVVRELFAVSGVGLPSGTRLLTAKRPDIFFPVNDANISRVNAILGRVRTSERHRANDYLAAVSSVRETAWCAAPKPDEPTQRRAWKARVALLDVLLYSG